MKCDLFLLKSQGRKGATSATSLSCQSIEG